MWQYTKLFADYSQHFIKFSRFYKDLYTKGVTEYAIEN